MSKSEDELKEALLNMSIPLDPRDFGTPVRIKESYNPNDAYICGNGHLQYNLTDEAVNDCRSRNVQLPPLCYEGSRCVMCCEPIRPLEVDVKELQFRVSNFMKMCAGLKERQIGLLQVNEDANALALYMRDAYGWEISQGYPQHSGKLSKAAIYYLQRERRRPTVVAGKMWRALLRMMGVR